MEEEDSHLVSPVSNLKFKNKQNELKASEFLSLLFSLKGKAAGQTAERRSAPSLLQIPAVKVRVGVAEAGANLT